MGQSHILFMLVTFNIIFATLLASVGPGIIPDAPNPLDSFSISASGVNSFAPASGTEPGNQLTPKQAQLVTCGATIGGGALAGAVVGAVGLIPGVVAGAVIGGAAGAIGCGIVNIFIPKGGQAFANNIASGVGENLGDFGRLLTEAILLLGALEDFFLQVGNVELALLNVSPVIGLIILPIQILTGFMVLYSVAVFVRGGGAG